jgi:hypothetical protein
MKERKKRKKRNFVLLFQITGLSHNFSSFRRLFNYYLVFLFSLATAAPADLRAALLIDREAYRVPSRWVVLDELPRLPNGKLDRRALPDPLSVSGVPVSGAAAVGSSADHDAMRRAIRDLWERMLPVGAVGLDEDFVHHVLLIDRVEDVGRRLRSELCDTDEQHRDN